MTELLSLSDLRALARDSLCRAGVPDVVAEAVATEVAAAEAAGERRHGMEALLRDLRLLRYGRIDPHATPATSAPRPGLLHVDAAHGFAAAALSTALGRLGKVALKHGIALLRLERSSDPGAMIAPSRSLAASGLACLSIGEEGPGRVSHPDTPSSGPLRHMPRNTLDMLLPPTRSGQPPDSPFGGLVTHGAWIVALDPDGVGAAMFDAEALSAAPHPPLAQGIALSAELIEQIVTA